MITGLNRSFVSQLNFQVAINRLQNTNFDLQSANIPGITLGVANTGTPFVNIPWTGDKVVYDMFRISFKVDESFANWFEIHKWMTGLGFTETFKQHDDIKKGVDKNLDGKEIVPKNKKELTRKIGNIYSDIGLSVLTSAKNPLILFQFKDAYPVAMSDLELKTTDNDVEYLTCHVAFKYTYYTVSRP